MSRQSTRVALVTTQDPKVLSSWSGTQYRIYEQLCKQFDSVDALGPANLNKVENLFARATARVFPVVFRKYNKIHNLLQGALRARRFSQKLKQQEYDLVFASACSPVVSFLTTDVPVVYLSDATFRLLIDYYQQFSGLSKFSLSEGDYAERKAIERADLVLMSSDWASQSAIEHYGAEPDKVKTVLFGANIEEDQIPDVPAKKQERAGSRCDLLFLARDWERKGGQVALDAFYELKRRGYDATLTICGCEPGAYEEGDGLTVIPFLDKSKAADRERYTELMAASHFLILPTLADCTPMVLAEANAYSMPVVTSDTGGIGSLVKEGESGFMMPVGADGAAYADLLVNEFFNKPEQYLELTRSARRRYESALNWDNWGREVKQAVETMLAKKLSLPHESTAKAQSRASL